MTHNLGSWLVGKPILDFLFAASWGPTMNACSLHFTVVRRLHTVVNRCTHGIHDEI